MRLKPLAKIGVKLKNSKYLAINFSNSLFFQDYLDKIENSLDIELVQQYSFPTFNAGQSQIRLEDHLTWNLCKINTPLLYFLDNFMSIRSNYYWFRNRKNRNDIIADRNGNIFLAKDIASPIPEID